MRDNSTPMMHLWTMANLRLLCIAAPLSVGFVLYVFKSKDLNSSAALSLVFLAFGIWASLHVDPVVKKLRSLARKEFRGTLTTADLQTIDWNSKLVKLIVGERAAHHWGSIASGDSSLS
jgi:hypothetical protein